MFDFIPLCTHCANSSELYLHTGDEWTPVCVKCFEDIRNNTSETLMIYSDVSNIPEKFINSNCAEQLSLF